MSRLRVRALIFLCLISVLCRGSAAVGAPAVQRGSPSAPFGPTAAAALGRLLEDTFASETSTYADLLAEDAAAQPTAVYDIMARVVVLPNGDRLEAHSGLKERADDPRFVAERMRGATPPGLYDLSPRKGSFHGIAALRLDPISGDVFGRTGLLAHTYMLHGRPESNGCVVFRDYTAFLAAFRQGKIRRLRVVPSVGDAAARLDIAVAARRRA